MHGLLRAAQALTLALRRRDAKPDRERDAGRRVAHMSIWVLNRNAAKYDTWEVLAAFSRSITAATDDDPPGQVQEPAEGGRLVHRGRGFGPVAVTRRCGTQSSTWWTPSNVPPSSSTTERSERRWNFTWVKSSNRT
jgi:hypothetical protein